MNADQLLEKIADAHEECLRLQQEQKDAATRRGELIRSGLASGVGAVAIAEALMVTRARIYAMAKER